MYINVENFLNQANNEKNISYFKGMPDFDNPKEQDVGEISINLIYFVECDTPWLLSKNNAVAVLQKLHDCYCKAHGMTEEQLKKVTDIENKYLYIDAEKYVEKGKNKWCNEEEATVAFPFVAAKGFVGAIIYMVGGCIKVDYDEPAPVNNIAEDKDENSVYQSDMRAMNFVNIARDKFEKAFKERAEAMTAAENDMPEAETKINAATKTERYKIKKFRTAEDLAIFLNRHNISKSNIIDIQHKWFSHTLIYAYEKERIM